MSKTHVVVRTAVLLVGLALIAASCGDGDGVKAAVTPESRVAMKQDAVTKAQADFAAASEQFCASSKDYILAIDRYAGIFDTSEVTVGDVKAGGADLNKPRSTVESSADDVVAARDALTKAEQELAEAEADLAASQAGATTTTADPATTTTTQPLLSDATVDRVKQAEDDLATAAAGITDETPLSQASAAFNAAAFALQVAWLQVYQQAGCLTDEQQAQATEAVTNYTIALQNQLKVAGLYDGEVDGVYGPSTVDAVSELQTQSNLPVTGFVDRATGVALDAIVLAKGGAVATKGLTTAVAVQTTLKLAGYWDGPIDGQWTDALTDALKSFQTALGVAASGVVDGATLNALYSAIAEGKAAAAATTTTPAEDETTTTAAEDETTTTAG